MRAENLETRLIKKVVANKRRGVFMRSDFAGLGEYDQVGRALRLLVRQGKLIKIGQGLYAKAAQSPFDGSPAPVKGLKALAVEALNRLGVKSGPSRLEKAYNAGRTNQVPSGRVIAVKKRVRRKIGYNGAYVSFERG